MASPRITFDLEGVSHSLYFGMSAIEIFSTKSIQEVNQLAELNPKTPLNKLVADPVKSFAYVIYSGLCNQADIEERMRPTYIEAYDIAEEILYHPELQEQIFTCFNESRAKKALMERLNAEKKSSPVPVK